MESDRYNDLNELHSLANITFQNVTNLTPALRQMVVNAKAYQKSVHTTCNLAVVFIDSLQNIAKAALVSEGATKKIGDVLFDIIETFKEIENMKLELTKLFINEVIIPLESRAEVQIGNMKGTHKSYNLENRFQTELFDKAAHNYQKVYKKSVRKKKRSPKLEAKERENARSLDIEESKLKKTREEGLRKALIEERRVYCFVAERMCAFGRGTVVYNNRISNFVNQKIPDWTQYIARPTELPAESEDIIQNPTGYKMGTVKRKVTKDKDALKRGKSFTSHYPTKYSTIDSRSSSRAGSRPSLSGISTGGVSTRSNMSDGSCTPVSMAPSSPKVKKQSPVMAKRTSSSVGASPRVHTKASPKQTSRSSPKIVVNHTHVVSKGDDLTPPATGIESIPAENIPLQRFLSTKEDLSTNEEAIAATIVASNNALKVENSILAGIKKNTSPYGRSHSFSVQGKIDGIDGSQSLSRDRAGSGASKKKKKSAPNTSDISDFATRLSMIQTELHKHITHNVDAKTKLYHKALYDHIAQDASQLTFQKGDVILPTCEPTSGWQYGEHETTKKTGWFPASYTVKVTDRKCSSDAGSITDDERRDSKSISGIDERRVSESTGDDTSSVGSKKPPPVAKKTFKKNSTGTGGVNKKGIKAEHDNTQACPPKISTSSSMPQMVHQLQDYNASAVEPAAEEEKTEGPVRTSIIQNQDSFDTTDEETNIPAAPGDHNGDNSDDSDDSLPPPPLPPPLSDDDGPLEMTKKRVDSKTKGAGQ